MISNANVYKTAHEVENAMKVIATFISDDPRCQIRWNNNNLVSAETKKGIINIPRMGYLDNTTLMKLRAFIYHESGHILDTKLPESEVPKESKRALFECYNALEDRRMEAALGKKHPGCEFVFNWATDYFNKDVGGKIQSKEGAAELWEALCAMGFSIEGRTLAWQLTPTAQKYYDLGYPIFSKIRNAQNASDSLLIAKELYEALKDKLIEEEKKNQQNQKNQQKKQEKSNQKNQQKQKGSGSSGESEEQENSDSEDNEEQDGSGSSSGDEKKNEKKSGKGKKGKEETESEEGKKEGEDSDGGNSEGDEENEDENSGGNDSEEGEEEENGNDSEEESDGEESGGPGDEEVNEDAVNEGGSKKNNSSSDSDNEDGDEEMEGNKHRIHEEGEYVPENNEEKRQKQESKAKNLTDAEIEKKVEEMLNRQIEGGKSLQRVLSEQIQKALENLPREDKIYTAMKENDKFMVPPVSDDDRNDYKERRTKIASAIMGMSRALEQALRSLAKVKKNPYLEYGKIDMKRLVAIGKSMTKKVFYTAREGQKLNTVVSIMIDESGSMSNYMDVQLLAIAICETLEKIGVPFEVYGASTVGSGDRDIPPLDGFSRTNPILYKVYKVFGESWVAIKERITHTSALKHNVDGEVVQFAASRLVDRKEKRKIVFSLSDGRPMGGHYNDSELGENLKRVCERCRKAGIEVYGFGIGTKEPKYYYGDKNFIFLEDVNNMGQTFFKALADIITHGKVKI